MSLSDFVYRPFETLIRPLDIPYLAAAGKRTIRAAPAFRADVPRRAHRHCRPHDGGRGRQPRDHLGHVVHCGRGDREGRRDLPRGRLADTRNSRRADFPRAAAAHLPRQYAGLAGGGGLHAGGHAMAGPQGSGAPGPSLLPRPVRRPGGDAHLAGRLRGAAADRRRLLQHTAFPGAVCRVAHIACGTVLAAGAARAGLDRGECRRWRRWRCRNIRHGRAGRRGRAALSSAP